MGVLSTYTMYVLFINNEANNFSPWLPNLDLFGSRMWIFPFYSDGDTIFEEYNYLSTLVYNVRHGKILNKWWTSQQMRCNFNTFDIATQLQHHQTILAVKPRDTLFLLKSRATTVMSYTGKTSRHFGTRLKANKRKIKLFERGPLHVWKS